MLSDIITVALITAAAAVLAAAIFSALVLPIRARGVRAELTLHIAPEAVFSENTALGARFIASLAGVPLRIYYTHGSSAAENYIRYLRESIPNIYIVEGEPDGREE